MLKFSDEQDDIKILTEWVHPEAGEDHRDRGRRDGGGQVRQEHLLDGVHVRHAVRLRYGRQRGGSELYGVEWLYFLIPLSPPGYVRRAPCYVQVTQVYRDPVSAASLVCHDLTDGSDGAGAASEAGAARTGSFHRECFDAEKIPNII